MMAATGKCRYQILAAFAVMSLALAAAPLPAAQDAVVAYPFLEFSPANLEAFVNRVQVEQAEVLAVFREKYADKPEKVEKHPVVVAYARILERAVVLRQPAALGPGDAAAHEFLRLQRLHFSLLAELGKTSKEPRLQRLAKMFVNVVGGAAALDVPKVRDPQRPVGEQQALREAGRLFRPGVRTPLTRAELAGLSALEISRLQPAADHPALSGSEPGNHFSAFLAEQTKLIRSCSSKLARFDFTFARKVMYYDELNEDATSPKIKVKDRYGQTWGLKWGDEVHTDVAMTRLAIDLGASYEDLKFYSGPGETLLILDPPGKNQPDAIKTWAQLADRLLNSKFQFHADRYLLPGKTVAGPGGEVLGHGIVDQAMIERESLDPKCLGAAWVAFKECQLSFHSPAIKRLGGAALSNVGAVQDRVARGSLVFNAWIKNKDMKDDNARMGLLLDPATGRFTRPVEFQSDLGCTIGALKTSGDLNRFESSFVRSGPGDWRFEMRALYVPASWKACTWADARWMALRIARLSRADLERCFADCGWPAYVQRVAVEKLLARRNELIEPFALAADGIEPLPCDPGFTLRIPAGGKTHLPVLEGRINRDSTLVQADEAAVHPEGLAEVISRKND